MAQNNSNSSPFPWSAAIGAIGGMASSAIGAGLNYKYAKKLQQHQYNLNQRALKESPLSAREGYVNAGYNPLLALGSQGMGFSANSAGVPTDLAGGAESGINSAIALKQNRAQVDNLGAQTNLVNQQAETEKAKRVQMDFQNAMTDVETHLKQKDLDTYERRFYASIYEQMQRAENYRAQSAVSQMNAETNRLNYQVNSSMAAIDRDQHKRDMAWRERHPVQADLQSGFGTWSNSIGRFLKPR